MPDAATQLIHRLAIALTVELESCRHAYDDGEEPAYHGIVRKLLVEAERYEREHA